MADRSRARLPLEPLHVRRRRRESLRYLPRQKPARRHSVGLRAGRQRRRISLPDQLPIRYERPLRVHARELQVLSVLRAPADMPAPDFSATMHNRAVSSGPAPKNDLFAAVVDGAGVGIVVLNPQRRIVLANAAFCSLLECANEDLTGIDEREITDDTDADLFRELLAGARTRYTIHNP